MISFMLCDHMNERLCDHMNVNRFSPVVICQMKTSYCVTRGLRDQTMQAVLERLVQTLLELWIWRRTKLSIKSIPAHLWLNGKFQRNST